MDDDGLDDLIVGAYENDDGGNRAGKAYLVLGASLGSSSEIDLSLADYAFIGEHLNDLAGTPRRFTWASRTSRPWARWTEPPVAFPW